MATYASATNPFLKASSIVGSPNRVIVKEAPGMAKPSVEFSVGGSQDTNLLIHESCPSKLSQDEQPPLLEQLVECFGDVLDSKSEVDEAKTSLPNVDLVKEDLSMHQRESIKAQESTQEIEDQVDTEKVDEAAKVARSENEDTGLSHPLIFDSESSQKLEIPDTDQTATSSKLRDSFAENESDDNTGECLDDQSCTSSGDNKRNQHIELIRKLRLQLKDLEKYAFERGELDQLPASVLAERQSVILDTLKDKLSLRISISEIEKLETDELKKQIDKEIHDLIDPLITKENLLNQLKTQLIDLERYIDHLHGTLGKFLSINRALDEYLARQRETSQPALH